MTEPPVRGGGALKAGEGLFLRADRLVAAILPAERSPLVWSGAIANLAFVVASLTGVVLLLWYETSVHSAYDSVEAMAAAPWTAELTRSLHRYSSDACLLFVLIHALRLTSERRFGGARWLAWVTGVVSVGLLWLIGWLGYWLVWDTRGEQVARVSALVLDPLPIFADPLSRGLMTDDGVGSLLFFLVFFIHMLLPLVCVAALWLHITRLSRARWLPDRSMTLWVLGSMVLVSLLWPATSANRAAMAAWAEPMTMDWWYLAPLALGERLSGGAVWTGMLVSGLVLFSVPWALTRGRAPVAVVESSRCNACEKCFTDCPYEAIQMVPRTDDKPYDAQAFVLADKCVGCGICVGSCDTVGVGPAYPPAMETRRAATSWIEEGPEKRLALVCQESAAAGLSIDPETGRCAALPGWRLMPVPCAGWVHPLVVEKALRADAEAVAIVSCGPSACRFREGDSHIEQRLSGARAPSLRDDKIDADRVHLVRLDRSRGRDLPGALAALTPGAAKAEPPGTGWTRGRVVVGATVAAAVLTAATWLPSDLKYTPVTPDQPRLSVSFKHPGQEGEDCRQVSEEELAKMPVHMRKPEICERRRASVRLLVEVDGAVAHDGAYAPRGVWGDGNSLAIEQIEVGEGAHRVRVAIADGHDPDVFGWDETRELEFEAGGDRVVLFDKVAGLRWY